MTINEAFAKAIHQLATGEISEEKALGEVLAIYLANSHGYHLNATPTLIRDALLKEYKPK